MTDQTEAAADVVVDSSSAVVPTSAAAWDLTPKVSPYLDLHMMFPLLEYVDSLISSGLVPYSAQDVAAARLSLLRPTHMVDYAIDIYRELMGDVDESGPIPEEMEVQKVAVFERLEELAAGCQKFRELCGSDDRNKLMSEGKWNVESLTKMTSLGVDEKVVETYRQNAKFNFDCGDYQTSRDMLENYLSLFGSPPGSGNDGGQNQDDDDGGRYGNKDVGAA